MHETPAHTHWALFWVHSRHDHLHLFFPTSHTSVYYYFYKDKLQRTQLWEIWISVLSSQDLNYKWDLSNIRPTFYSNWVHLLDSQNLKSFWQLIFPFAGNCCLAGRKKSRSNNQLRTKPVTVDSVQHETDSVVFSWNKASLSSLHFERNNFYSYIFTFEYSAAHPVVIYSLLLSMSGAVDILRLELYWCSVLISNIVRQYWHKTIRLSQITKYAQIWTGKPEAGIYCNRTSHNLRHWSTSHWNSPLTLALAGPALNPAIIPSCSKDCSECSRCFLR